VNHEEELIKAFFLPTKRQRYLDFIAKPTTRRKFLRELGHFKHLDPRYAREIRLSPSGLESVLKGLRVPDSCWVISEDSELDGRLMLVSDVLIELGRHLGTFLSFVPGKLAYFEDEDGAWILQRP